MPAGDRQLPAPFAYLHDQRNVDTRRDVPGRLAEREIAGGVGRRAHDRTAREPAGAGLAARSVREIRERPVRNVHVDVVERHLSGRVEHLADDSRHLAVRARGLLAVVEPARGLVAGKVVTLDDRHVRAAAAAAAAGRSAAAAAAAAAPGATRIAAPPGDGARAAVPLGLVVPARKPLQPAANNRRPTPMDIECKRMRHPSNSRGYTSAS